jgi:hypothetical protein
MGAATNPASMSGPYCSMNCRNSGGNSLDCGLFMICATTPAPIRFMQPCHRTPSSADGIDARTANPSAGPSGRAGKAVKSWALLLNGMKNDRLNVSKLLPSGPSHGTEERIGAPGAQAGQIGLPCISPPLIGVAQSPQIGVRQALHCATALRVSCQAHGPDAAAGGGLGGSENSGGGWSENSMAAGGGRAGPCPGFYARKSFSLILRGRYSSLA